MQSKVVSAELRGWYPDGFTREALSLGDVRDFSEATSGLMQAGFIEPADEVAVVEDVPEPVIVDPAIEPEQEAPKTLGKRGKK